MIKLKIMIVDDDPDVADLIKTILKEEHWEIRHATDGFEAGRILMEYLPDLITLDLVMPGMDGFKVCHNIKSDPLTRNIKVLSITAYDTPEYRDKIISMGADGYLQKPFTPEELVNAVQAALDLAATQPPEEQILMHKTEIINILERAASDNDFVANLYYNGADALNEYRLTRAEKLALLTGDILWIEKHIGTLRGCLKT